MSCKIQFTLPLSAETSASLKHCESTIFSARNAPARADVSSSAALVFNALNSVRDYERAAAATASKGISQHLPTRTVLTISPNSSVFNRHSATIQYGSQDPANLFQIPIDTNQIARGMQSLTLSKNQIDGIKPAVKFAARAFTQIHASPSLAFSLLR